MKAGAWMFENITDPVTGKSEEPQHASVCRAFQLKEPIWNWWEQPENIGRLRRFGAAMSGTNKMQPPQTILSGKLMSLYASYVVNGHALQRLIGGLYLREVLLWM